jgi:hypothetical protein
MATPNLTRSEIRKLARAIRAAGYSLPRIGWSVDVPITARAAFRSPASRVPRRVVRDVRGYYFTAWE